jgi:hypothetical protein
MSANPVTDRELDDPFADMEESREHAPEPWQQDGRYIRDTRGAIVVRGRSAADARRIVAAINGVRGIPTEALEGWKIEDVSNPLTRPDFEVEIPEEIEVSPYAVAPSRRRESERRRGERRAAVSVPDPQALVFDRRVFQRRREDRRRA